ncbi:hypothetical protein QWJ34_26915 [Saccharibacillus sp. CPCC 101409]|uniref:hypothetical protein n=1 Tax=Saccharibacillus sp. CPCC 101409 TaxID=3058041 RepID=UPI002672F60D|nr:hypothetical protein [Saccharibacillus sp. CPCC 101409]MDO3413410.1 hypothetical protein [Saccharibacillus sp. CPCC 101409]
MILKEFDLDLPYVGEDAEDYEQSWKSKRIQFRNECRCIASMTERYFKNYRYKTPISWKLMIVCYSDINKSRKKFVKSEVYEIHMEFDIARYFNLNVEEKKRMIFNVLKEGAFEVLKEEGWNSEPFIEVFSKMENDNLVNRYQSGKAVYNPKRNLKAMIICEHEISEIKIYVCIADKRDKEVVKKLVIQEVPNEWKFHIHLGKLQWISEEEVILKNKKGLMVGTVQVTQ